MMLFIREATARDLPLILAWRNNPLIWEGTYTQRNPITWENHREWWDSRNTDHHSFMVVLLQQNIEREVGVLHISLLDYWSPEIGIIIGEIPLWDKGIGTQAFELGCDWLKDKGYQWTSTTAPEDNHRVIKMLKNLGFTEFAEARKGEKWFRKKL